MYFTYKWLRFLAFFALEKTATFIKKYFHKLIEKNNYIKLKAIKKLTIFSHFPDSLEEIIIFFNTKLYNPYIRN